MHLKTYALDNDLLGNYQTTGDFLAKNADFSVLGLKITKFGDFHEKMVFAAQITIFRPLSPTINNPQGILMVWGVAGAEKCENDLIFMIFMKSSWILIKIRIFIKIHGFSVKHAPCTRKGVPDLYFS